MATNRMKRKKRAGKSVDWRPSGFSIGELRMLRSAGCRLDDADYAKLRRARALRAQRNAQ
jgi:hypothetical protein